MRQRARSDSASPRDLVYRGVSLCFFLSGMAGLVYQMVWMRYLSTVFGTSELAIVTVLVAYMGGLAVGAGLAARFLERLRRPVLVYAVLEAAIALSALAVPALLKGVGALHAGLFGGQPAPPSDGGTVEALAYLGLSCIVLLIPTACMGATLPLLAKGVIREERQIGRRVGALYALNTFGAVAGTVCAAFFFIPALGLWKTSFVGVGLNLLVAVLGWFVAMRLSTPPREESAESAPPAAPTRAKGFPLLILGVMLVSGALSFGYEVLWARLLSHVLGGSLYAFATMLAAFLGGIALGGLLGALLSGSRRRSCHALAVCEIATGLLSALIFLYVGSDGFARARPEASLGSLATLSALVLMPATICLGATLPLAVRSLSDDPREAGAGSGRVYAWNTIGAIAGAIAAGYFLIPALGFAIVLKGAVLLNLVLGAVILLAMRPRNRWAGPVAVGLVVLVAVGFHPSPPLRLFTLSPLAATASPQPSEPTLLHHAVGHSATVALLERRGSFLLRTNGLPEAEVFARGAEKLSYTRIRWLPALPKVLRPETETMLVVGFGGGALLEAVPSGIASVDVVELESEVIRANELIADRRALDPLRDERLNVIINDARGALRLTDKRYDAIVSQPSHPWTAGSSHLYTREFLELARAHLDDRGVFVQWLGAHFVDEDLFRSFAAAMQAVFPHNQLYLLGDNFVLVGSPAPLDENFLAGAGEGGSLLARSDYTKISFVEDVLAALQLDEEGFRKLAAGHQPITDDRNRMATHHMLGSSLDGSLNEPDTLVRVLQPLHYLNQASPALLQTPAADSIDYHYLVRLLGGARQVKRPPEFVPPADRLLNEALEVRARDPRKCLELLARALETDPGHRAARAHDAQTRLVLTRRQWASQQRPLPADFATFLASDPALQSSVQALTPQQQRAAEAEHLAKSGQLARVRALDEQLATFTDHRDPFYQGAVQARLQHLLDPGEKDAAAQEADARKAADLLDHVLALPLFSNLSALSQRIALAQRFGDTAYQVAAGWIMARQLASAPPGTPESRKDIYRAALGAILKPYATRRPRGGLEIADPGIRQFYVAIIEELGPTAFPPEFR